MSAAERSTPEIELRGLSKRFGDCVANEEVNLRVRPGSIVGIVGENGAGKSTAMKILFGLLKPSSGQVLIDGKPRAFRSPHDAIAHGIGMVHQHFMLAGPMSVLDNILLGAEPCAPRFRFLPRAFRPIDRAGARRELEPLVARYAPGVSLDAPVESLPVGLQQKVEILKLLYRKARVLILDEPTAVLTPAETEEFFVRLRELRAEGRSIVIITHKLKEVLSLTDEVMVLRGGRTVLNCATGDATEASLAEAMVGGQLDLGAIDRLERRPFASSESVLSLEGFSLREGSTGRTLLRDLTFDVRTGEVVGIAGVNGNGQTELVRFLARAGEKDWQASGKASLFGAPVEQCERSAIGLIPEDRHHEAVLLEDSIRANTLLGFQRSARYSRQRFGLRWIDWRAVKSRAQRILADFDVRPAEEERAVVELSGGNQQKVVVGRELEGAPRFVVAAQPTRGVDVGAIDLIHRRLLKERERGAAVLLVSSELDEVLTLSDRVLVFSGGQCVAEHRRGAWDRREIGIAMGGSR